MKGEMSKGQRGLLKNISILYDDGILGLMNLPQIRIFLPVSCIIVKIRGF